MGAVKVHPALMHTVYFMAGAGVGAAGSAFANQALKTAFPTAPLWVAGLVEAGAAGAAAVMTEQTPFMMGLEAGFGGMGIAFALNETFISLPGISGMPQGVPNATPGYISRAVNGYYRNTPPRTLGNFSGSNAHAVNGLYTN
jgi:hypothetical protein